MTIVLTIAPLGPCARCLRVASQKEVPTRHACRRDYAVRGIALASKNSLPAAAIPSEGIGRGSVIDPKLQNHDDAGGVQSALTSVGAGKVMG